MLDWLAPFAVPGGLGGLVLAVAWMVFVGKLVPARIHDRALADRDAQIETWRAAYAAQVERADKLAAQNRELTEIARVGLAVMQALPRPSPESAKDAVL